MSGTAYSLLDDPFVETDLADGRRVGLTLPGLLAALVRDGVSAFPGVQAHQRHAWHATLVQVAAIAMHASGEAVPPADEGFWRGTILSATPDACRDTAWCLVAPDDRPAFMQPAVAAADVPKGKALGGMTDLDVLITSKNHDVKIGSGSDGSPSEWLAALVSMQTQVGFGGRGNVGVARMNGGFSSRAGFGLVPPGGPGARFRRDLLVHLDRRDRVIDTYRYKDEGGHAFLWMLPWEGDGQLSLQTLDPYFVEVARRARLSVGPDGMTCRTWNNDKNRVSAKDARGNLGDLWTVVVEDGEGRKALTGDAGSLGYDRLVNLILGGKVRETGYEPSPLTAPMPGDPRSGMAFSARLLVRGQGKSEGYHERTVPVAHAMVTGFGRREGDPYGLLARAMVAAAWAVARKSLTIALMTVAQGGPAEVDFGDTGAVRLKDAWMGGFHRAVDGVFFERLAAMCGRMEAGEAEAAVLVDWYVELHGLARACLDAALDAGMLKAVQAGRARARSESALARTFRAVSPDAHARLFPPRRNPGPDGVENRELEEADA